MRAERSRIFHVLGLDEPRLIKRFYIYSFIIVAGCVAGAVAGGSMTAENSKRIGSLIQSFLLKYTDPSFGNLFLSSFLSSAVYFLLCVVSSGFAFGMAVTGAAMLVKGLGCGMVSGMLCCNIGISGFVFYVLAILPGFLISCVALSYLSAVCCESAVIYFNSFYGRGKKRPMKYTAVYNYILCAFILTAAAIFDAALGMALKGIL